MCTPTLAVTALTTAVSMASQYQEAKYQEKSAQAMAEYSAQMAGQEAEHRQQLARQALADGEEAKNQHLRAGARQLGQMRATAGAGGFALDEGTNLSLLGEAAEEIQHEANVISNKAEQNAWAHQVGATGALNEMNMANYKKRGAGSNRSLTNLGLAKSLLGGVADGINKWDK